MAIDLMGSRKGGKSSVMSPVGNTKKGGKNLGSKTPQMMPRRKMRGKR